MILPRPDVWLCMVADMDAVAAVIRPELITWQPVHLHVLTHDPAGRGVAITDLLFGRDAAVCAFASAKRSRSRPTPKPTAGIGAPAPSPSSKLS